MFKCYCIIKFLYVYQVTPSLTWIGIYFCFRDCFYITLLIMFIRMFGIQYWKCNSICNSWKIKEKLKGIILDKTYQWVFLMHLKYIRLVILKRLFILGLSNFKFSFKISWPSFPTKSPPPFPTKTKISDPPPPPTNTSKILLFCLFAFLLFEGEWPSRLRGCN